MTYKEEVKRLNGKLSEITGQQLLFHINWISKNYGVYPETVYNDLVSVKQI